MVVEINSIERVGNIRELSQRRKTSKIEKIQRKKKKRAGSDPKK